MQNQAVVAPQQLPKIFSSKDEAALAIKIVLGELNIPVASKAERINVIQQFCAPQSLAWQECEDTLKSLAVTLQPTAWPAATY